MRLVSSVMAGFILFLGACSSDEVPDGERYPVTLPSEDSLEGEPCSGVGGPDCPAGTFCATVNLEGGLSEPTCVSDDFCEEVSCADDRECVVAESFPALIFCSGTSGEDGDEPVES